MCSRDDDPTQHQPWRSGWTPEQIADSQAEAREHGHPNWSHAVAHGPCTKPSRFGGVGEGVDDDPDAHLSMGQIRELERMGMEADARPKPTPLALDEANHIVLALNEELWYGSNLTLVLSDATPEQRKAWSDILERATLSRTKEDAYRLMRNRP